jgi:thioredoxin-related protein
MKAKVELIANTVVILLALVIGSVYLKDRFSTVGPESNEIKVGDKLPHLDGWDWSAHDRTLVLVLRKGCHFCEDSAPFYQRLAAKRHKERSKTAIVAVFPDARDSINDVVQLEEMGVRALPGVPLESLKVSGTPSLLLVDGSGTVLNAWIGMLSPKQELEVLTAVACPGDGCRQGA